MQPQLSEQVSSFHSRATVSRIASAGTPRKPSSRRSCRIRAMASRRFCRHSSTVSPCPLAPGISGQYAQYPPSDACSITAVNSFRMAKPYAFTKPATSAALGPNGRAHRPPPSQTIESPAAKLGGGSCGAPQTGLSACMWSWWSRLRRLNCQRRPFNSLALSLSAVGRAGEWVAQSQRFSRLRLRWRWPEADSRAR